MTEKKQLSKEGELRFAAEFVRRGWSIFNPFGEDTPIDLLISKDGVYKRIQVKSTKQNKGIVTCRLKSSNNWQVKKYTSKEIDFFGIYEHVNRKGYLIPIEDVEGLTEASLRIDKTKNNQEKGVRYADKYLFFDK